MESGQSTHVHPSTLAGGLLVGPTTSASFSMSIVGGEFDSRRPVGPKSKPCKGPHSDWEGFLPLAIGMVFWASFVKWCQVLAKSPALVAQNIPACHRHSRSRPPSMARSLPSRFERYAGPPPPKNWIFTKSNWNCPKSNAKLDCQRICVKKTLNLSKDFSFFFPPSLAKGPLFSLSFQKGSLSELSCHLALAKAHRLTDPHPAGEGPTRRWKHHFWPSLHGPNALHHPMAHSSRTGPGPESATATVPTSIMRRSRIPRRMQA